MNAIIAMKVIIVINDGVKINGNSSFGTLINFDWDIGNLIML